MNICWKDYKILWKNNVDVYGSHFSKTREIPFWFQFDNNTLSNNDESDKQDLELVLSYISKHYDNPELSLQVIKKALHLHENKISSLIKEATNLSYKDYVHKIRITEAKRLFKNSNLLHILRKVHMNHMHFHNNFQFLFWNFAFFQKYFMLWKCIQQIYKTGSIGNIS